MVRTEWTVATIEFHSFTKNVPFDSVYLSWRNLSNSIRHSHDFLAYFSSLRPNSIDARDHILRICVIDGRVVKFVLVVIVVNALVDMINCDIVIVPLHSLGFNLFVINVL